MWELQEHLSILIRRIFSIARHGLMDCWYSFSCSCFCSTIYQCNWDFENEILNNNLKKLKVKLAALLVPNIKIISSREGNKVSLYTLTSFWQVDVFLSMCGVRKHLSRQTRYILFHQRFSTVKISVVAKLFRMFHLISCELK